MSAPRLSEAQWKALKEIAEDTGAGRHELENELCDLGLVRCGFVCTHLTELGEAALKGRET